MLLKQKNSRLGRSPIEACRGGELKVLRERPEADAEHALYLSVREIACPLQSEHFLDSAHGRPVSRHRRKLLNGATLMPADWSTRSTAITKPMIRFGLPTAHSGNPNSRFGNSNNCFGTPASLFDFNRNVCSSSSENPVRHQPKCLFGFAELRTITGDWPRLTANRVLLLIYAARPRWLIMRTRA